MTDFAFPGISGGRGANGLAGSKVIADPAYAENVSKLAGEFRQYSPNELCAEYVAEILGNGTVSVVTGQEAVIY